MRHKILFIFSIFLASGSLFFNSGCMHKSDPTQLTSSGRHINRAPAEFNFEEAAALVEPQPEEDPYILVSKDGKVIDCHAFDTNPKLTRYEDYNGKTYKRYNVSEAGQLFCPQIKAMKTKRPWIVKKTSWSKADEDGYIAFIQAIGRSKCNTADSCLSGPSNILRDEIDMINNYYTDCADLPYYLRAYYAYKNNLPMSFVLEIAANPFTPYVQERVEKARNEFIAKNDLDGLEKYNKQIGDLRYSSNGNQPISRFNIPNSSGVERDFSVVAPTIVNVISSGFLRMASKQEDGLVQSDFYSPKINDQNIIPGTVLYNESGHVAVVYEITKKGDILFMDAHPDNSLSRGKFNSEFKVYKKPNDKDFKPHMNGGNFKNFRPFVLESFSTGQNGVITKGKFKFTDDAQLNNFSLEQYNGDALDENGKGIFKLKPSDTKPAYDFLDWAKYRVTNGTYRLTPVEEIVTEIESLCLAAEDREIAVQAALKNKIHLQPHPATLPRNIYGTDGAWESYSSPGRDNRFRAKIKTIADLSKSWISRFNNQDEIINYNGSNLKQDILNAYNQAINKCNIKYTNSVGGQNILPLKSLITRAALISFDPYNCPELRWGANTTSELATCTDDAEKKDWYAMQQFLRNRTEKNETEVLGHTLPELKKLSGTGKYINIDESSKFNLDILMQGI